MREGSQIKTVKRWFFLPKIDGKKARNTASSRILAFFRGLGPVGNDPQNQYKKGSFLGGMPRRQRALVFKKSHFSEQEHG